MMNDHGGSELSLEDLMVEYSSRPPQIAEWLWCIEYVAKFVKDIRCILDLMKLGYKYSNDHGRRINEILSLRILEFMFDPSSKNDSASTSKPRVEFDFSSSNADVLRAILKMIPVSKLRAGMPELSKFNIWPFIAHKNMCLPQCALEKLRDVSLTENQTPFMEADDPTFRDDRSAHMNTYEDQEVHISLNRNINEMDKVISSDDEDEPMHNDEIIVIDGDSRSNQDTSSRTWGDDARVKCTKNGTWLISGSDDDESDMVTGLDLGKEDTNLLRSSSLTRVPDNKCWKCKKEGTLLICSRRDCAAKVHKECLSCEVNVDEDGNFHCPVCWYNLVAAEYFETHKLLVSAKTRLLKCFPLLTTRSKRLDQ